MDKGNKTITIEGSELKILHSEGPLGHCFGAIVNGTAIIRSEAVNTHTKAKQLVAFAEQFNQQLSLSYRALRLSSMQLTNVREEWTHTHGQHAAFSRILLDQKGKVGIAHIGAPTEHVHYQIAKEYQSELTQLELIRVTRQFNSEACIQYCIWICEEIETLLRRFKPEASEEYTLQARFEDFCHEIRTPFLTDRIEELNKAIAQEEALADDAPASKIKAFEKEIASNRLKLQQLMEYLSSILYEIPKVIDSIASVHPELADINIISKLAWLLMQGQLKPPETKGLSWGQLILLLQLLDQKLGVISAINGFKGLERTNLVFAIRLALAEIAPQYSDAGLLNNCLKWGAGSDDIFTPDLQTRVLQNYKALGVPSNEHKVKGELNKELVSFLPSRK